MYKIVTVPDAHECGAPWWFPETFPKVITYVEKHNPGYRFVQLVNKAENGRFREFIVLKEIESTPIQTVIHMLQGMSEENRVEVFSNFCQNCGTTKLPCHCENDE